MMPSCDHTGVPRHFHSSTTSGSASLTRARTRASVSPRQSPSSAMRASISSEGESLTSGVGAVVAVDLERGVGDEADEDEPGELAEAGLPHAAARHVAEQRERDRAVEQAAMAVAERGQAEG